MTPFPLSSLSMMYTFALIDGAESGALKKPERASQLGYCRREIDCKVTKFWWRKSMLFISTKDWIVPLQLSIVWQLTNCPFPNAVVSDHPFLISIDFRIIYVNQPWQCLMKHPAQRVSDDGNSSSENAPPLSATKPPPPPPKGWREGGMTGKQGEKGQTGLHCSFLNLSNLLHVWKSNICKIYSKIIGIVL